MSEAADLAKAALSRGDLIAAYDATVSAIEGGDESKAVRHQQVLALARMGDTERAMGLFEAYGLDRSQDPHERAAGARLLKDRALASPEGERLFALERAFEAYHAIYLESGDSFPGINAATLALLAGREQRARELAAALLGDPAVAAAGDYYMAVTKAEALLILGGKKDVAEVLRGAAVRASRDHGARSGSARQLSRIAAHLGMGEAARRTLVAPLAPPKAMHFCGHMFTADAAAEARFREEIDEILAREDVGFAYGALACGGDMLIAEVALDRGVPLHVVLPFDEEDFLAQSVRPGGEGWEARFRACIERAASVVRASETEFFGDPRQYGYGSRMAMGLARLRAAHLAGDSVQVAIWDGKPSHGAAGTGADVAAWKAHGGRSKAIGPGDVARDLTRPPPRAAGGYERALAAILFTGFKGFSTLKESALPAFW
ncbi:MAG TPA: tetratricopeptide repeat-containing protein, partial [Allosphingosinicella sp.]|nr:tetratricopeptide repeat-containing protein [Allosphingosinicella sp.]